MLEDSIVYVLAADPDRDSSDTDIATVSRLAASSL
jgi:hypothetical protein